VAAEREARVVEMLCWRLGKWRVQGLMCWWRLGLRVYARGGSREEVLGDGGTCELTCCRGELLAVVKNSSTKLNLLKAEISDTAHICRVCAAAGAAGAAAAAGASAAAAAAAATAAAGAAGAIKGKQGWNMVLILHSDSVLLNTKNKLLYSEVSLLYEP
jgi:hypothetical protein